MMWYLFLDWFFMLVHPALIIFNLTGWLFRKTRKANLVVLLLTGGSWLILGIWKGIGYCPLTDWHYQVLQHMGAENLPNSYIAYLLDRLFACRFSSQIIDGITVIAYLGALFISSGLTIRDFLRTRAQQEIR